MRVLALFFLLCSTSVFGASWQLIDDLGNTRIYVDTEGLSKTAGQQVRARTRTESDEEQVFNGHHFHVKVIDATYYCSIHGAWWYSIDYYLNKSEPDVAVDSVKPQQGLQALQDGTWNRKVADQVCLIAYPPK